MLSRKKVRIFLRDRSRTEKTHHREEASGSVNLKDQSEKVDVEMKNATGVKKGLKSINPQVTSEETA